MKEDEQNPAEDPVEDIENQLPRTKSIGRYRSQVKLNKNESKSFSDKIWVISVLDTGQSTNQCSVWLGHTMMVVEGMINHQQLKEIDIHPNTNEKNLVEKFFGTSGPKLFDPKITDQISEMKLFIGQYDIVAEVPNTLSTLTTMVGKELKVSEVRIFEESDYGKNYSEYPSRQYYAKPESVIEMIKKIKQDRKQVRDSKWNIVGSEPIKFKILPKENEDAVNCSKWVKKNLKVAGLAASLGKKTNKPKFTSSESRCVLS